MPTGPNNDTAKALRRFGRHFGGDQLPIEQPTKSMPSSFRYPAIRDRDARYRRRYRASQAGSMCRNPDATAQQAALLGERRNEWLLRSKTAAAVQEQNGSAAPWPVSSNPVRPLRLSPLPIARDSLPSRRPLRAFSGRDRLRRKRCTSTSPKECPHGNSCIAPAPYTLKYLRSTIRCLRLSPNCR